MTLAEKIAKLKELDGKATPKPWDEDDDILLITEPASIDEDADLIAYLRNNALAMIEEMLSENERLRNELNWYQVEAVARTNTDARTKP